VSEQDGGILRVTINRPDTGNAVTALDLTGIIARGTEDLAHGALRGAGKGFYVGRQAPPPPATAPEAGEWRRFSADIDGTIRNSPTPVVCVVQGRALGFGCAVCRCRHHQRAKPPPGTGNAAHILVISVLAEPIVGFNCEGNGVAVSLWAAMEGRCTGLPHGPSQLCRILWSFWITPMKCP